MTDKKLIQSEGSMDYASAAERVGSAAGVGSKVAGAGRYLMKGLTPANLAMNVGIGVGIEGGIKALQKKQQQKLQQPPPQQEQTIMEILKLEQPPMVMVLKRKSVRLYPNGEKIALYRNDKLGINFAVPYDDEKDGVKAHDADTLGSVSEGIGSMFKKVGGVFKGKKKVEPEWVDPEEFVRRWRKYERDADALKRAKEKHIHPRKTGRAIAAKLSVAAATGYALNKGFNYARDRIERPNKKRHGGSYVYEAVRRHGPHGTGKEFRSGAWTRFRRGVYKYGMPPMPYLKTGAKLGALAAGGSIAYDVAKEIVAGEKKKNRHLRKHKVVVQEFLAPLVRFAAQQYVIGKGISAVSKSLSRGTDKLARVKAAKTISSQQPSGSDLTPGEFQGGKTDYSDLTPGEFQKNEGFMINEASKKKPSMKKKATPKAKGVEAKLKKATVKVKKTMVPSGLGKELTRGVAIAVGTAVATKAIDSWYDKWRDSQEIKLAAAKARAEAKAKHEIAPRHIEVEKKEKPGGVTVTKKRIVEHTDGSFTELEPQAEAAIETLYEQLNDENKALMLQVMTESYDGLAKITQFAFKHQMIQEEEEQ